MTPVHRVMRNHLEQRMSLESLEGLPEEVSALYKKGEDGKFHLEGSDGLKSALQKEREARKVAETALKDREAAEAKAKKDAEDAQALAKGEFEKVNATRDAALKAAQDELQQTRITHENHLKESKALMLLGPVAATPKTLESLTREFMGQLEVVQGNVLVKGDPAMTPEKLAEKFKADPEYAPFLKPSGANGSGSSNHQGGGSNSIHARHKELSDKPTLSTSESRELLVLAGQIQNESKP